MTLSNQQQTAFDKIMAWMKTDEKIFVLAGYAGTGKTTLAKDISNAIENTVFGAFTGKAAHVLRSKGCEPCGTLHSYLYQAIPKAKDLPREKIIYLENNNLPIDYADDDKTRFAYDPIEAWKKADLCIVDEYSMLHEDFVSHIVKDAKKVLFLGDPEQLSPIDGKCPLKPDYFLTEIHRHALESSIIRFSQIVREDGYIPYGDHGDLKHVRRKEIRNSHFVDADQVICGKNTTRLHLNNRFRADRGFASEFPMIGDKMVCRKNNKEVGLYNGLIGYATNNCTPKMEYYHLNFKSDEEGFEKIKVWNGGVFLEDYNFVKHRGMENFQYAYAITCHMTQGSEFDNLLVLKEPFGGQVDRRRWMYTAITRAKKQCLLVEP